MTTRRQARQARRKLKQHDKGFNRHHKLLSYDEKRARKDLAHKRQVVQRDNPVKPAASLDSRITALRRSWSAIR